MKKFFKISSQKSASVYLFGVVLVSVVAVFAVFSGFDNSLIGKFLGSPKAKTVLNDGIRIETAVVGACSVGLAERKGALDVSLVMDVAQCQEKTLARIQLTNLTSKVHKNIEISCVEIAADGCMINRSFLTVPNEIKSRETIVLDDLVLKSIDERTARIECAVLGSDRI
ncbi:hypothetical protein [Solidesulfovibrio magneticus]|uniref:Uncharacterized protein n=1 Tax=Solidesulfovibrio magneticus (strain ATCC 700980 / DSM 13731 / RS-1) TaxID=573370 RepID=C4XJM0_SOLM1|nr:hypothetical protein [Solidesulfovibrio magneticus]BAH76767.1 hypothetical protein DMR_32760 [Solidesulfovibrio magneticus RS-1]